MSTRSLSRSQAAQCESAATRRCRCRCGGALHGANRIAEDELDRLPSTDPHRVNESNGVAALLEAAVLVTAIEHQADVADLGNLADVATALDPDELAAVELGGTAVVRAAIAENLGRHSPGLDDPELAEAAATARALIVAERASFARRLAEIRTAYPTGWTGFEYWRRCAR